MPLPQTELASPEWATQQNLADWLTDDERRAGNGSRHPQRRRDRLAARMAAKRLLQQAFGLAPRDWEIGTDGLAPVALGAGIPNGLCLSLSHSEGWGAASFSLAWEGHVGLDIQRIRPVRAGFAERALTRDEQEQCAARFAPDDPSGPLLFWALKEAAIKTRRAAWGRPLKALAVTLTEDGQARIALPDEPPRTASFARLGDLWAVRAVRPRA